ncbi:Zn(II)2Cys6 transcription factor [Aspergillus vadensis CBS 113365]|uniref:C6 zinc finger domain protein n=1 Tax=Aspergillus vadensis (strain CBS 113365 / IMI 142717 / IBT 24658) TaxID=1448311 RepID=A0A319BIV8_ASPVC|nr:C6 zinc finger domain protein [Aspergillus vadensis CBS 113365]PYH72154.1 C6 zinc finger domain protein [Aspergillus vadensis CBS 113365]
MSASMPSSHRSFNLPSSLPPLNQSCESCRALKVRCLPDPNVPRQCQRCTRTRRTCVFARTLRRQPRKKTGSRVAQLERDVRDLRSLLHDQIRPDSDRGEKADDAAAAAAVTDPPGASGRDVASLPALSSSTRMEPPSVHNASAQGDSDRHARNSPAEPAPTNSSLTLMQSPAGSGDVVDRGIVSLDMAQTLVSFFINEQMQFYPMVVLPSNTTAESLRRTSPVLFLSILAASSMTLNPHLAETLNEEMLKIFAERFFLRQEKSVELIQSILLMLIFYFPPTSRLQGQYYQYTHIATTMTLELGIAAGPAGRKNYRCHGGYGDLPASIHSAQARAVLGCYHFASNIGIRTHRPNMLRFNDVIDGYIHHLRESTIGLDQQIATWFGLQRIVDDTLSSLGQDNTLVDISLRESQMLPILNWFDSRMLHWKRTTPKNMLTTWMNLEYHHMYLAIYELAAGESYRDPDAPTRKYYTLPPLEGDMERHKANAPITAARVQIITKWLLASHQMLDAFLECDTSTMRKLPNMTYTRMILGISSLLRIYHTAQFGPLGEVVSSQMMDVDGYLDRVGQALLRASGDQKYRVPSKWYHVVAIKNREWFEQIQKRIIARPSDTHTYLRGGVPPPASGVPMLDPHRGPGSASILPSLGSGMVGPAYAEPWYVDDAAGRVDPSRPFPAVNAPVLYMGQMQPVEGGIGESAFPLPVGDEPWRLDESMQESVPFPY